MPPSPNTQARDRGQQDRAAHLDVDDLGRAQRQVGLLEAERHPLPVVERAGDLLRRDVQLVKDADLGGSPGRERPPPPASSARCAAAIRFPTMTAGFDESSDQRARQDEQGDDAGDGGTTGRVGRQPSFRPRWWSADVPGALTVSVAGVEPFTATSRLIGLPGGDEAVIREREARIQRRPRSTCRQPSARTSRVTAIVCPPVLEARASTVPVRPGRSMS